MITTYILLEDGRVLGIKTDVPLPENTVARYLDADIMTQEECIRRTQSTAVASGSIRAF